MGPNGWYFVILCLCYFSMRGVVEGIVMVKMSDAMAEPGYDPGPRSHVWFRAYHWFALARDGLLIAAVWFIYPPAIPGVLLLGWELTEIMYSTSRYALLWPNRENFLGLNITIRGTALTYLHALRTFGGILLLSLIH
jgi:hypothetical protein